MRALVLIMAVGLLGFITPGIAGDSVPQEGKLHLYPGDRVVLLGDSITASFPWHTQFTTAVDLFYTRLGLTPPTWINSGVNGDATNDISGAEQTRIFDHNPDVLIYGPIGFNDVGNIPEAQSIDGYTSTWDLSLAEFPNLRTLAISPWVSLTPGTGVDAGNAAAFRSLRTAFASVCRTRGIPFVDVRGYWDVANYSASQANALNTDGAHPTDPLGRALLSSQVQFQTNTRTA